MCLVQHFIPTSSGLVPCVPATQVLADSTSKLFEGMATSGFIDGQIVQSPCRGQNVRRHRIEDWEGKKSGEGQSAMWACITVNRCAVSNFACIPIISPCGPLMTCPGQLCVLTVRHELSLLHADGRVRRELCRSTD